MSTRQLVFTTRGLDALKPGASPYDVRASGGEGRRGSGLRLRVAPSGTKTFRWVNGGTTWTLGRYGDGTAGTITLADAGKKLAEYKTKVAAGIDPEGTADGARRLRTVADLVDLFYRESIERRRKRPGEAKRILDTQIVPVLGRLPLAALDTVTCRRPVQQLVNDDSPRSAAIALALLKQLLNFGCEIGVLDRNPAAPLKPSTFGIVANERKRWLTADEIPAVLRAIDASDMDESCKLGLKLLLFAGLRTAEAITLEWSDVDLEAATLSVRPENLKLTKKQAQNAEPYVVPLSGAALAALRRLRELAEENASEDTEPRWVFSSAWSRSNRLSDKALCRAMARLWKPERKPGQKKPEPLLKIPRATPHDFRRTLSTHVSDTLGLPPHVAQLLLGHSLAHLLGSAVAGVYDRAKRLDERRRALESYAVWVEGLLTDKTAEILPLRA
ncbi:MAG TPA: tyrosine-type recombinase/integrase [Myxococcales bacterium]|jgi:integrase